MDIGWKMAQTGAVLAAGLITDGIVKGAWKLAMGRKPPAEDDTTAKLTEIILVAVISGVILAVTKRAAVKTAANWYGGREIPAERLLHGEIA